jgi:hypothetical protein
MIFIAMKRSRIGVRFLLHARSKGAIARIAGIVRP